MSFTTLYPHFGCACHNARPSDASAIDACASEANRRYLFRCDNADVRRWDERQRSNSGTIQESEARFFLLESAPPICRSGTGIDDCRRFLRPKMLSELTISRGSDLQLPLQSAAMAVVYNHESLVIVPKERTMLPF